MVAPPNANLEGLMSIDDLDTDVEWIVSNYGARQLDYAPATISALEEVVEAVAGAVPVLVDGGVRRGTDVLKVVEAVAGAVLVLVDGGVRRGTDVLKALALGARAVMVGRPVLYGLAARGEAGAKHVIEMLNRELELAMALGGCWSVGEIARSQTEGDQIRALL